jgi:hypothetical protein
MDGLYFLYFFIFLITIVFIVLSIYFFSIIKLKWNVFLLILKRKLKQYKKLLYLCYKHKWEINDWIFNSFVYFYKHEYKAIEDGFEIEKENFPSGKIEIVNAYRYITRHRKDNIKDFKDMIIKDRVEIFGSFFISYNFKVDEQRRIHVHPSNNGNVMIAQLKHSNMLYELDNEVARWIIEKRKFFNI